MNTREQFGKYLLLKKLTEDPLGETFRAGLLGATGMERVALLRIFNGQGLDGQRLWEASKDRQGIQNVLRSPNIGEGIEVGEIQGIPYAAYEYISGKNMATLLEQAAKKHNFIPTEHALLITERVALALAAASENRLEGERILHGFVVPQLTMISNEGETRLLGFEVAPALRGFAVNPVIRQHFGRYLSPETLAGEPPDKADDIYSLGVLLFELLSGRPLPPPGPEGYGSVIDQGVLATEQEPIPEELRQLLKKSLVPRGERMNEVVAWHKKLNSWMFEGQYNPTTFNLAFFMHNLFRQEIERENQEIEVEKTLPLPLQQAEEVAAAVPAVPEPQTPVEDSTGVEADRTENFIPEYAREDARSKTGLWVAIAVVALLVVAGIVYLAMRGFGGAGEPAQPVAVAPPPPPPPEPQGPTPEEIQAQIQDLVAKKTSEFGEQLRAQYEKDMKDLERQLADAKKAAERRRQAELERQRLAEEEAARLEREKAEEEAAEKAAAEKAAAEKAAAEKAAAEKAAAEKAAAEAPPPPPKVVPPPPPPPPPQVRRGDLVEMGPGVQPPETLRLAPRFPDMARRLHRSGATVTVKALVDENGRVLDARLEGEKVGFGFETEALQAVKSATFKPATKNGVPVKVWFTVKVEFKN